MGIQINGVDVSTVTFATPAIVLGAAAAAGAATTVIRSDGTIAAFDATNPSTQAFGDSPVVGTIAFAARRDHKHGMMANPVTIVPKTADEIVNNSTNLQNDDHLFFAVGANEVWQISIYLYIVQGVSASADFKAALTTPNGGAAVYEAISATSSGGSAIKQYTAVAGTGIKILAGSSQSLLVLLNALVINGGTAGNIQFQWAQNFAVAVNTTLKANSCIVAHKLV